LEEAVRRLDALVAAGRMAEVEQASRTLLAEGRFYLWHLYLILALLRTGRRDEAARELDVLFSYKFNIEARAWPEIKAAFPEKFGAHYVLNTMRADQSLEAAPATARRWNVPHPIADPSQFAAAIDALIAESVPALAPIARERRVTTFGSCFAANLARGLREAGIDASNLLIEESINSPLANRAFLEALASPGTAPHTERIRATFGDDFAPRARERLAGAEVIVLTLGVAPSLFHRDDGRFAFLEDYRALLASGRAEMKTPTVAETSRVVSEMLALLRVLNPRAQVFVTVSPVPLMGTAEMASAVLADCVSKSSLRAALHEALATGNPAGVAYWPSFEIVRWLGGHAGFAVYGADDGNSRHVAEWVVALIVERFLKHVFAPAA
jgi:hypothetical protein